MFLALGRKLLERESPGIDSTVLEKLHRHTRPVKPLLLGRLRDCALTSLDHHTSAWPSQRQRDDACKKGRRGPVYLLQPSRRPRRRSNDRPPLNATGMLTMLTSHGIAQKEEKEKRR